MLDFENGVKLQAFDLKDVLGRTIQCDDGVSRYVETIAYSHRYPDRVLINEINEDETPGGTWVHALSLSCQMFGNPIPTRDQCNAFSRVMSAFHWQPAQPKPDKDGMITLPSGLAVRAH